MKRNINLNYGYNFFQYFVVTGLWMLYLTQKGFSTIEVGLMEGIFHVTSFLFEVPSGSLGDRFGYKNLLIASRVVNIISCLLTVLSANFWIVTVGFVLSAVSYNLASGTNEALVFESLKSEGEENRYIHVSANIGVLLEFSSSAGIVIAGIMSDWFFDGVYWIQILMNIVAIFLALQFVEPKRQKCAQQKYFELMKSAFTLTKSIPGLAIVMLSFAFLDSINATYYFYFQNYFAKLGIAGFGISIVIVISSVFQIIGAKIAPIISERFSLNRLFLMSLVLLATVIGFSGYLPMPLVIMCYVLANSFSALITPIRSNYINQLIPSGERATINSIDSLCFSLMMIPFFPLGGVLIHWLGYQLTFAVLGVVVVGGGLIGYGRLRRE